MAEQRPTSLPTEAAHQPPEEEPQSCEPEDAPPDGAPPEGEPEDASEPTGDSSDAPVPERAQRAALPEDGEQRKRTTKAQPPPRPARLGGTEIPEVEVPPRMARSVLDRIVRRTKLSPDEHHDRVRASVSRMERQHHDAQRELVRRTAWMAKDLRHHILREAETLAESAEEDVRAIGLIIAEAKRQVDDRAALFSDELRGLSDAELSDMEEARRSARRLLFTELRQSSPEINAAAALIADEHVALGEEIRGRFEAVGATGFDPGQEGGESRPRTPIEEEGDRISASLLDSRGSAASQVMSYTLWRSSRLVPPNAVSKQRELSEGGRLRGQSATSEDVVQQWTQVFLGFGSSTVDQAMSVAIQDSLATNEQLLEEQGRLDTIRRAALDGIEAGRAQATEDLDDTGEQCIKALRQAAREAKRALEDQAIEAENGMLHQAPLFADQWREISARVAATLPRGVFLDLTRYFAPLRGLEQSGKDLERRQLSALREQDSATRAGVRDAVRDYRQSFDQIVESAQDAADGAVQGTAFEMAALNTALTGSFTAGTSDTLREIQEHAEGVIASYADRPGGVERAAREFLEERVRPNYEDQVRAFARQYEATVAGLESEFEASLYPDVAQAVQDELRDRRSNLARYLPGSSSFAADIGLDEITGDADDSKAIDEIVSVPREGRRALREHFDALYGSSALNTRIYTNMDTDEAEIASNLLLGTRWGDEQAARDSLASADRSRNGVSTSTRDLILRSLDDQELAHVSDTHGSEEAVQEAMAGLSATELRTDNAYGDRAQIARFSQDLDDRLYDAAWESDLELFNVLQGMERQAAEAMVGQYYANLLPRSEAQAFLTEVYREHEVQDRLTYSAWDDEPLTHEAASAQVRDLSDVQLRDNFIRSVPVGFHDEDELYEDGGGEGSGQGAEADSGRLDLHLPDEADPTLNAIREVVHLNEHSTAEDRERVRAREASLSILDAEREGMDDAERCVALTRAVENPALNSAREDLLRIRAEVETLEAPTDDDRQWLREAYGRYSALQRQQDSRMLLVAQQLQAADHDGQAPITSVEDANQLVTNRLAALYAQVDEDYARDTAEETVRRGRASLYNASMLAMGGHWDGTHEDLLEHAWSGRSHREIAEADARYASRPAGEDALLWVFNPYTSLRERVGSEVSGDLAMRLELAALGVPETEADHIEIALLRHDQQLRGTGDVARVTMDGTAEAAQLSGAYQRLEERVSEELPPELRPGVVNGRLTPEARAFLDRRERERARAARVQARKQAEAVARGEIPERPDEAEIGQSATDALGRSTLTSLAADVGRACQEYQDELDRQEATWLLGVQLLGALLAVVLMLSGVGIVLSAVIAAALTGAMTIATKQGFRGERYGSGELALDVGQTLIEMAAAGIGAAWARAAGPAALRAALRGAIVQGTAGALSTAIDDRTWRRGWDAGLGQVALSSASRAVTGAVSEGLTTRLGHGLSQRAMGTNLVNAAGQRVTGAGSAALLRSALAEGASNAAGATLGEGAAILLQVAAGQYHGSARDAMGQLTITLGRELLTGFVRGAGQARARNRYLGMRQSLLDRGTAVSDAEYSQLSRFARASGMDHPSAEVGLTRFRAQLGEAQTQRTALLAALPDSVRLHVHALPISALTEVTTFLHAPTEGIPRMRLLSALKEKGAADLVGLGRAMDREAGALAARRSTEAAQARVLREQLGAALPPHLSASLRGLPISMLAKLPAEGRLLLAQAMARAASGDAEALSLAQRAALIRMVRDADPGADIPLLRKEIEGALAHGRDAEAGFRERRDRFIRSLPGHTRRSVAALPPVALEQMMRLAAAGEPGTAAQRAALIKALLRAAPDASPAALLRALDAGADAALALRRQAEAAAAAERAETLAALPKRLRGPLSALSDEQLRGLRDNLAFGRRLSPAELLRLTREVLTRHPNTDEKALRAAIRAAEAEGSRLRSRDADERRTLRESMLRGAPPEQRRALADVPILQASAAELAAHTGDPLADVAVVVVDGRVTVLVREGADPRVLREAVGLIQQLRDPAAAALRRRLDEGKLRQWDQLSLREQIETWTAKLDFEVDQLQRSIAACEATAGPGPLGRAARARAAELRARLVDLQAQRAEVRAIDARGRSAIERGQRQRPALLDRPPRLTLVESAARTGPLPARRTEPQRLASRLRQMEAESKRVEVVTGSYFEEGVHANGLPAFEADGSRSGYGIRYAYEVRTFSDGVTDIRLPIHLRPQNGVSQADLLHVQRQAVAGLERMYAGRHQVPGPDGQPALLRVMADFVDDPARALHVVDVLPNDGQAFQNLWFAGGDAITHAHEMSHMLGLIDEYQDHGPYGWFARNRRHAGSPGVHHDGSLMGAFLVLGPGGAVQPDPRTRVHTRHIEQIIAQNQRARAQRPQARPPPALKAPGAPPRGPDDDAVGVRLAQLSDSERARLLQLYGDEAGVREALRREASLEGLPLADTHLHTSSLWRVEDFEYAIRAILERPNGVRKLATMLPKLLGEDWPSLRQETLRWLSREQTLGPEQGPTPLPPRLLEALQRALVLLPSQDESTPRAEQFFRSYRLAGEFIRATPKAIRDRVFEHALTRLEARGVRYVELRGMPSLARQFTRSGNLTVRAIYNLTRGRVWPALAGARRAVRFLGFRLADLGGVENSARTSEGQPRDARAYRLLIHELANRNLEALAAWMQLRPEVLGLLRAQLSVDGPLRARLSNLAAEAGVDLDAALAGRPLAPVPDRDALQIGALNRLNRLLVSALADLATTHGVLDQELPHLVARTLLPDPSIPRPGGEGPTDTLALVCGVAHSGEQVKSKAVTLHALLQDLKEMVDLSVPRVAHGVILGIDLTQDHPQLGRIPHEENLRALGFVEDGAGGWSHRTKRQERYTADQITRMDELRLSLIRRIADDGLTLELNVTSNRVLSGLGVGHPPLRRLLETIGSPPLRLSVNTDNPGRHGIDVRSELTYLLATRTITPVQAVLFALEGFASSLGPRPLAEGEALAAPMLAFIGGRLSARQQSELLMALQARYPDLVAFDRRWLRDSTLREGLLRLYMRRIFQSESR